VASTGAGTGVEVSRVTVVAPTTRVDLALPSDVPLAALLPTLLHYAGERLADDGGTDGGWILTRLGGRVLDAGRTAAQLEIRDGELLYFTPKGTGADEMVFDDVIDAVATATQQRKGRWQPDTTRRFSVSVATLALLGGAVAMLFAGPPLVVAGAACLVMALGLVVTGGVLSRAFGQGRSSLLLALVAVVYAGVGGLLVLGGDHTLGQLTAVHVVIAATAVVVYGALAMVAVGHSTGVFLGASGAGFALGIGAATCLIFQVRPAAAAAVVCAVVFALIPALPMFAYRLARLPIPSVPTGPDDLKADVAEVDGLRILALSERADEYLTGLLGTVAFVLLGGELVLALDGQLPALLLCLLVAVLLMLRARPFSGRWQRLPLLLSGTAGLGLSALSLLLVSGPVLRLTLIPGCLLVIAVVALAYGLGAAERRASPVWVRLLDIVEILLIAALVPMTAWVCGAYAWIRAING
jgi:type VII secretion integral membrane protein EccD